jgi:hypothetical protein
MRLQDLIRSRKRELDLTWAQIEHRTIDAGHPISSSMLHYWVGNEWANIPPTETLLGLAAALEVDRDEVLDAAEESLGLRIREVDVPRGVRGLIALTEGRTPEQIAALERILRTVVAEMDTRRESPPS